jgi:hypothetical protein
MAPGDGNFCNCTRYPRKGFHVVFSRELWIYGRSGQPGRLVFYQPLTTEGTYFTGMRPCRRWIPTTVSSYTLNHLRGGGYLIGWIYPPDSSLEILPSQPSYDVGDYLHGPRSGLIRMSGCSWFIRPWLRDIKKRFGLLPSPVCQFFF